jgi:hypothetical protein
MLRLLVVRKIVGDDLSHMKIVRKLKGKYRFVRGVYGDDRIP